MAMASCIGYCASSVSLFVRVVFFVVSFCLCVLSLFSVFRLFGVDHDHEPRELNQTPLINDVFALPQVAVSNPTLQGPSMPKPNHFATSAATQPLSQLRNQHANIR
jgi:hypothetical protein